MDRIVIKNLQCLCILGDEPWEREKPRPVSIDLEMECDCRPAGVQDTLDEKTPDYARLAQAVLAFVEKSSFRLIEGLAEGIAKLCLTSFPLEAVTVRLAKPGAIQKAESVSVEIHRRKR